MLKNHLITAIRNIRRSKLFSVINIAGLSIGMASSIMIFTYVFNKQNFDTFHVDEDNIVRLIKEKRSLSGEIEHSLNTSPAMANYAKQSIPGVKDIVYFFSADYQNNSLVYADGSGDIKKFHEGKIYYTTSSFFDVFNFDVLYGNPQKSFLQTHQIVLTKSIAEKYFDDTNPVGKTIALKNNTGSTEYEIAGVIEDLPYHTHFDINVLISAPTLNQINDQAEAPGWLNVITYLSLQEGADRQSILAQIKEYADANIASENKYAFEFQPLRDIHLISNLDSEFKANTNLTTIRAFSIIGIIVLLIAWVNYINLSSIKAAERFKEIGIRKTLGSNKWQLAFQFISETFLLNLLAFVIAVAFIQILSPFLSTLLSEEFSFDIWLNNNLLVPAILIFILGSTLSGFYSAFIVSGYKPIKALTKAVAPEKGSVVRKALVLFQFVLSIVLVSGVVIVYNQITFMQNEKLGINLDNVLIIKSPPADLNSGEGMDLKNTFKSEVLKMASVEAVATSSKIPGIPIDWSSTIQPDQQSERNTMAKMIAMDLGYPEVYDFNIIAGRFYTENDNTFRGGDIIVNEKVLDFLGIEDPNEAIGQTFSAKAFRSPMKIIGVVEDYHHLALKEEIQPMLFVYSVWSNYYSIELISDEHISSAQKGENLQNAVNKIQAQYERVFGKETAFEYFFQDQMFNEQYKAEVKFASIFTLFSGIAILIAGLGLFGLTYYFTLRKTMEICIRKIFGASSTQIVVMLNKKILLPVFQSIIIAVPVALFLADYWLKTFPYRIELNIIHFLTPVIIILILAIAVVSIQSFKSAVSNPAETLKSN